MSVNIPSPPAGTDEFYAVMHRLADDARVVKSAHFIAAQRKSRNQKLLGVSVVVINILIGSGLIEELAKLQSMSNFSPPVFIKLLAFAAAALAGIQTFFNFQKEVECHTTAGDVYISIKRRLDLLLAEYKDNPATRAQVSDQLKAIQDEFLKANDEARPCIPTDKDYADAREGTKERPGSASD